MKPDAKSGAVEYDLLAAGKRVVEDMDHAVTSPHLNGYLHITPKDWLAAKAFLRSQGRKGEV